MRILLICDTLDGRGGWYTYTRNLHAEFRAVGHDVAVCGRKGCPGPYGVLQPPLTYMGNPFAAWAAALALKRVVAKVQPDIVHITVEPYAMLIPFAGRRIAQRTILTIHGSYGIRPLERWPQRMIALRYYAGIARFITVSDYTKAAVSAELARRKGAAFAAAFERRTDVVCNGVCLPETWEREVYNAEKRIILVGGIKPRKGVLETLDACALYKKRGGSPFTLSLVGTVEEDDYVRTVREKAAELNLQEEMRILGPVSDERLAELYRSADLYLMPALTVPNTFEGFGLVYIEANSYGVPCIGPDDSGAKEAIVDGESGYRVAPQNASAIAERIHWILDQGKISRAACRKWAEKHSIEKAVQMIEKAYAMLQSTT